MMSECMPQAARRHFATSRQTSRDARGSVRLGQRARGPGHREQARPVADGLEGLAQASGEIRAFGNQQRATCGNHCFGILRLVIVHRMRERHQNRWRACRGEFGERQRAGAADDEVRPGVGAGHVFLERHDFGVDAGRQIRIACLVEVRLAALMAHFDR